MFNKDFLKNFDFENMIPKQKEIEEYKVITSDSLSEFNSDCNKLIKQGFEPYNKLLYTNNNYYIREFVKYKAV